MTTIEDDDYPQPPGQDVEAGPAPRRPTIRKMMWQGDGSGVVAAGYTHSVVLREDSSVFAFGNGNDGQLGTGRSGRDYFEYLPVPIPRIPPIRCVAAGDFHTAIVTAGDGRLLTCGNSNSGQCGHRAVANNTPTPRFVEGIEGPVVGAACGSGFTVAVLLDGSAIGFGDNDDGQLGLPLQDMVLQPRRVEELPPAIAVAAGMDHCIFLLADETVATIGNNFYSQLGNGTEVSSGIPYVLPNLRNVISIGAGMGHTAAVTGDGRVATWGYGTHGQLGHREIRTHYHPRFIDGINDAISVSCGDHHTAIVHRDGTVSIFGWVKNYFQLFQPAKVDGIGDAVAVSCGFNHTIIQHADGRVSTFGVGFGGELGLGNEIRRTPRVPQVAIRG
jgi:alpha-tubulin suppressor-like RCC1 family protein